MREARERERVPLWQMYRSLFAVLASAAVRCTLGRNRIAKLLWTLVLA